MHINEPFWDTQQRSQNNVRCFYKALTMCLHVQNNTVFNISADIKCSSIVCACIRVSSESTKIVFAILSHTLFESNDFWPSVLTLNWWKKYLLNYNRANFITRAEKSQMVTEHVPLEPTVRHCWNTNQPSGIKQHSHIRYKIS